MTRLNQVTEVTEGHKFFKKVVMVWKISYLCALRGDGTLGDIGGWFLLRPVEDGVLPDLRKYIYLSQEGDYAQHIGLFPPGFESR